MNDKKTVMDLLDELKKDPELHPDAKVREVLVEKLMLAMIEN